MRGYRASPEAPRGLAGCRARGWVGPAIVLVLALIVAGCVSSSQVIGREVITEGIEQTTPVRSAANLPMSFEILAPATVASDCPPLLRDPGLNVTLTLRHSVFQPTRNEDGTVSYGAIGDYGAEPRGRYGEGPNEGLRIDCTRLRPMGIVTVGSG